jgi:hypothetical protein
MTLARTIPVIALIAAGCGASEKSSGTGTGGSGAVSCVTDSQCAGGGACLVGICVAPPAAVPGLAIEITPPPEATATASMTERVGVVLNGGPVPLKTDAVEDVRLSFRDAMNTPVQMSAIVTYTLPSLIPGRPPLLFSNELAAETSLSLSASQLERPATVRLVPRAAAVQASPPFSFVAPPGRAKVLTIPDVFAIRGVLRDAAGNVPGAPFVARAFQGQSLISTVSPLAEGEFVLIIPVAARTTDVIIQLVPDSATDHPWFAFNPFTPSGMTPTLDLEPVALAPYLDTNKFVVRVVGDEEGRPPLPGTLVRASMVLETTAKTATSPGGTTRFQREALVNADGIAELDLLPGTSQNPRHYDLHVIPDAQSPYYGYCQKMTPVTAGPGTLLNMPLKRRPLYTRRVVSADDIPIAGVTVKATRQSGGPTDCTSSSPVTTRAVTGSDGTFEMWLEPGMYQFDYDPAQGSPAPRLTDFLVEVNDRDAPDPDDDVALPRGALVDGYVRDGVGEPGNPVARAIVRIFQPRCTRAEACAFPPQLLAETQTDDKGYFRVVMAVP